MKVLREYTQLFSEGMNPADEAKQILVSEKGWQEGKEVFLNEKDLRSNPNWVFVFGDNEDGQGYGGAAKLRDEPNVYGFLTCRHPINEQKYGQTCYYQPEEYVAVYKNEIKRISKEITKNPNKVYMVSKLGAGLANKYKVFDKVIKPNLKRDLGKFDNVIFLW